MTNHMIRQAVLIGFHKEMLSPTKYQIYRNNKNVNVQYHNNFLGDPWQ